MKNKQKLFMSGCVKSGKPITALIKTVMKMSKRELRKIVLDLILGNMGEVEDEETRDN